MCLYCVRATFHRQQELQHLPAQAISHAMSGNSIHCCTHVITHSQVVMLVWYSNANTACCWSIWWWSCDVLCMFSIFLFSRTTSRTGAWSDADATSSWLSTLSRLSAVPRLRHGLIVTRGLPASVCCFGGQTLSAWAMLYLPWQVCLAYADKWWDGGSTGWNPDLLQGYAGQFPGSVAANAHKNSSRG